jgi:hypothetical protein
VYGVRSIRREYLLVGSSQRALRIRIRTTLQVRIRWWWWAVAATPRASVPRSLLLPVRTEWSTHNRTALHRPYRVVQLLFCLLQSTTYSCEPASTDTYTGRAAGRGAVVPLRSKLVSVPCGLKHSIGCCCMYPSDTCTCNSPRHERSVVIFLQGHSLGITIP